jgi:hypothetical protein
MSDEARRATARDDHETQVKGFLRLIRTRPRRSALVLATLVAAAAAALFLSAPSKKSPTFLARAEAALTPPPGVILHENYNVTNVSKDLHCSVTYGPSKFWIDQTAPRRFRILLNEPPPPTDRGNVDLRREVCGEGTVMELGGAYDSAQTLMFVSPSKLSVYPVIFSFDTDPVANLRFAIRSGHAHDEGKTKLKGRTVERIRLDAMCASSRVPGPCLPVPGYAYVDPKTFDPVEIDGHGYTVNRNRTRSVLWTRIWHISKFEYLPRTPANLALTNIRAQHPNATGP